ncbi:hypothetical protein RFI_15904, partial [Reticulomyxa filosa]
MYVQSELNEVRKSAEDEREDENSLRAAKSDEKKEKMSNESKTIEIGNEALNMNSMATGYIEYAPFEALTVAKTQPIIAKTREEMAKWKYGSFGKDEGELLAVSNANDESENEDNASQHNGESGSKHPSKTQKKWTTNLETQQSHWKKGNSEEDTPKQEETITEEAYPNQQFREMLQHRLSSPIKYPQSDTELMKRIT